MCKKDAINKMTSLKEIKILAGMIVGQYAW